MMNIQYVYYSDGNEHAKIFEIIKNHAQTRNSRTSENTRAVQE